jgi:hypothetical protein
MFTVYRVHGAVVGGNFLPIREYSSTIFKMSGYNSQGRIVRGRNVRGRDVRVCITLVPPHMAAS